MAPSFTTTENFCLERAHDVAMVCYQSAIIVVSKMHIHVLIFIHAQLSKFGIFWRSVIKIVANNLKKASWHAP